VDVLTGAFRRMQHELRALYGNLERQLVELRQAEEALRQSEAGFRTLVNSSPEGILRHDLDGFLIDANRSFTQMTGYTHSELRGKHIGELVPGEHKIRLYESIEGIKKGQLSELPLEIELTGKNGYLMSVIMRGWLVRGEDGEPFALGAFVADITEEKRLAQEKKALEEQLLRNQKMEAIGTMAGGIAHDFNNILTGIMGYTKLAMLTLGEDFPNISSHLSSSLAASNRARELVRQLLRFSRQEASALGPTSLRLLLKEAIQLVRSTLPSTIRIEAHIGAEKNVVMADPTQLHQVIMNLCINAYHAMKAKGGTLSIELQNVRLSQPRKFFGMECLPGPYAVLTVTDTGVGIAPENMDRIFEPYFTTKKPNEGTGLGLSVTFGVIKSHGGMIEVESTPGKGSAFSIYLPLIQQAVDQAKRPAPSIPKGDGEHILVVDDEFFFRDVVSAMLKGLNYRVSVYEGSLSALNAYTADPMGFDAVITDQTMPHMTGIELISKIREVSSKLPIILCTGYSDDVTEESSTHYGITCLLHKPISREELGLALHEALECQSIPY
jgi:PAS domain S-box-containing protein